MGSDLVVQGNLDPALVLAGMNVALDGAMEVLRDNGGHPGHIFNLGHGVQPDTDPGVLTEVVALVHEQTAMEPSPS
jgi:uroporphyrinogen decarboxylase